MSLDNNKNLYDDDISKTQQLELDRYQKYLKSIKKYDPLDEEEYLYLTNEMNHLITNNDKLSDIEVLELTKKLEKIDNTKDYTVELLELTKEIKKITSPVKKTNRKQYKADIPKVDKKENPKKEQIKPLTSTSILPKINNSKKKEEKIVKQEDKKSEEVKKTVSKEVSKDNRLTFKDLIDKNNKNNSVDHFNTEKINKIRVEISKKEINKKKKKSKKVEKIVWSIIFGCSLCVFVFLILRYIKWEFENRAIEDQISDIYALASVEETVNEGAITNVSDLPVTEEEEPTDEVVSVPSDYWYYMSMSLLDVNFDELKKKNDETAGWIQVAGTNINYPYVHTSNNDYYLTHSFDKSYNSAGWVYLDYRNDPNEFGRNNILYAHSRLDNTMFGSLRGVISPSWYNNSNNHVVKISTPTYNSIWQVFSVYTIEPESYYIRTKFTDTEFSKFLNTITSRSVYDFGVTPSIEDKVLTLSSCYYENKRVVLHAKLIRLEEK